MSVKNSLLAATALLAASTVLGSAASAADALVGLVNGDTLVTIDPSTRAVTSTVKLDADDFLGIDVRPADGKLYGLTEGGEVLSIDAKSGKTAKVSELSEEIDEDAVTAVDFNPMADRLRVIGNNGANLRVNVADGKAMLDAKLAFKQGDANAGKTPRIVAASYTNSMKGAKETQLYGIDAGTGSLVLQNPPNDGVLNTVGALGVTLDGPVAFNIVEQEGNNQAWLANGNKLYEINLQSGKATQVGQLSGIEGNLTDIAWWYSAQ
jgi:hypothetical protein